MWQSIPGVWTDIVVTSRCRQLYTVYRMLCAWIRCFKQHPWLRGCDAGSTVTYKVELNPLRYSFYLGKWSGVETDGFWRLKPTNWLCGTDFLKNTAAETVLFFLSIPSLAQSFELANKLSFRAYFSAYYRDSGLQKLCTCFRRLLNRSFTAVTKIWSLELETFMTPANCGWQENTPANCGWQENTTPYNCRIYFT